MRFSKIFLSRFIFQGTCTDYRIFIIVVIILTIGCSEDSSTNKTELSTCNTPLTVSVNSGITPTFSWEPSCKLAFLIVEHNGSDMWFIYSDENNIEPGVEYGIVPDDVSEMQEAEPLIIGTTYSVAVRWRVAPGNDFDNFSSAYVQTFTPE